MKGPGAQSLCTGVTDRRREAIKLAGLASGCFLLDPLESIRHAMGLTRREGFEEFASTWQELAAELADGAIGNDGFLHRLAGALASLGPDGVPPKMRTVYDKNGMKTGPAYFENGLLIVVVELMAGAVIPPHRHNAHDILTVGLKGFCTYRHYQIVGEAPESGDSKTTWRVQETRSGIMTRGRSSDLTVSRDHIHTFHAGEEGATILDFLTKTEDAGQTPIIHIEEEPREKFLRIHDARWTDRNF